MTVPSPWRALARTSLVLVRAPIAELGRYYHHEHAIVIRSGIRIVEERATLWHELVHHRRRHVRCHDEPKARGLELSVDREAARLAMPLWDLAESLRRHDGRASVADALLTTERMLDVRLEHLHPAERAYLRREELRIEWAA